MTEWYVGRKANFQLTWYESYRRLLRMIDTRDDSRVVRVIRRSKPIEKPRRGSGLHRRNRAGQAQPASSEWGDKDYYIYLGIAAPSYSRAQEVGKAIFTEAERVFQVGFGDIFPPQGMDEKLASFLIPTEFPLDGRIPPEQPREEEDLIGAFAFYEPPPPSPTTQESDSCSFDRLLSWLSAAGDGRWESFLRVAKVLGAVSDLPSARRLFRRFVLLGHLESSPDGRSWSVAPPVLVQAAMAPETAFWCGSRSGALLRMLPGTWQKETPVAQLDRFGPSRWAFRLPSGGSISGLPACSDPTWEAPSWGGAAANRLAALLPDIKEWTKTLGSVEGLTPPDMVEQWNLSSGQFEAQLTFRVEVGGRCTGPAGLYRLTYGEAPRAYQLTVFFDPGAPAGRQVLRGEWYGLRFLALRHRGKYVKAMWREENGGILAVPYRQRWPLLYERALVLASGFLPYRNPENGLLYYQGIPQTLAEEVAEHLGVEVEMASAQVEG